MKIGHPFDADGQDHLNLHRDVHVGMELQVNDLWRDIAPWAICTVQQADDGRLYIETNDGTPMFLAELIDPMDTCGGCLNGMFKVQPPPIRSEMLPLPHTLPDNASAYQTLSVVEDMNADCAMHVNFADSMDYAESWGAYLADVARVMARDYPDYLRTNRPDGDLFAAFCDGFNKR